MKMKPISTAPKDGRAFLSATYYKDLTFPEYQTLRWDGSGWSFFHDGFWEEYTDATHWMDMPEAEELQE